MRHQTRTKPPTRPYIAAGIALDEEILERAKKFYEAMQQRRTIRDYSDRAVPREVIEYCLRAAGTAPSGANLQPWHFVAVGDPKIKRQIRVAAEKEERSFMKNARRKHGWTRSPRSGP